MALEKLTNPPIVEVVSGIGFSPISGLDPVRIALYWNERRKEFPSHRLLPALTDDPSILLGGLPLLRTWFISADEVFVLQMQEDRFYMNWRARDHAYPRFSDHGSTSGLLSRVLKEFELFSTYCSREFGQEPEPRWVELAKIDHFVENLHWTTFTELVALLPSLLPFSGIAASSFPRVALRFSDERNAGTLTVTLDSGVGEKQQGESFQLVKLETRFVCGIRTSVRAEFEQANDVVNNVFASLVPPEQRAARFK